MRINASCSRSGATSSMKRLDLRIVQMGGSRRSLRDKGDDWEIEYGM